MTCGTCLRWRRLQRPNARRWRTKFGRCFAPIAQKPAWATLTENADGSPREPATPTCGSGLLPETWGDGCPAHKVKKLATIRR